MKLFEVPLAPGAQVFSINLLDRTYQLRLAWNAPASCWVLDVSDPTGLPLALGLPLVTGADLLGQLAHLGLGGGMLVTTDSDAAAPPAFGNLGTGSHLYFFVQSP